MSEQLDHLDRHILDRLRRLGRMPVRAIELVAENRYHDADEQEIRRRLVRLEMLGFIRSDHFYAITGEGRDAVADKHPSRIGGNAQAA